MTAGLAIYDTMQYILPPISTWCVGQAASMGSLLLASGTPGKQIQFKFYGLRIPYKRTIVLLSNYDLLVLLLFQPISLTSLIANILYHVLKSIFLPSGMRHSLPNSRM